MAVMEVQFPSGFTADLDTLPSLEVSENVMKVETKNGHSTVIVYFDHLTRKEICPTLDAFRTQKVAEQRPASVTIYDYYDNCTLFSLVHWNLLKYHSYKRNIFISLQLVVHVCSIKCVRPLFVIFVKEAIVVIRVKFVHQSREAKHHQHSMTKNKSLELHQPTTLQE